MAVYILILVLTFAPFSYTANILAIMPTPSYSHQIAFTSLWKELSLRGHSVTLITTDPINDHRLVNLTEIDVRWTYKLFSNISKIMSDSSMWSLMDGFLKISLPISEEQLSYPPVQDLIHNKDQFDVVLVEHFFPEFLGFAEIYQCPKILIASLDTLADIHNAMGNPSHPVLYPEIGTNLHGSLTFGERVIITVYSWYMLYFNSKRAYPVREKLIRKYFNITVQLEDLIHDVDLLLLNVNPVIQGVRAVGPTTINIGGFRPALANSVHLPKDLEEFLDSAKDGFIYFSLGSNVKSKELSEQTLNSIIEALSEIPYKVLWKFEADDLPGKPQNVKLIKWAPQQQVLAHQNIKLFVTQGGLQSMEEGIYGEVPFVVIPYFGDQEQNANLMRAKGIAKIVNRRPFVKKSDLKNAILEVIQNPSYRTSVRRLKQLALDTPMTGIEKAVWWTEYVIRNKGTKHLRNPTADLPSYQYYLLDVITFLVVLLALAVWLIIVFLKVSIRWISVINSGSVVAKKSKKQ